MPIESNAFVAEFDPKADNARVRSCIDLSRRLRRDRNDNHQFYRNHSISVGDVGTGIAVDSSNNIWVTGLTASTNFPLGSVGTPFQATNKAGTSCGGSGVTPNPNAPATAGFVRS